MNTLNKYMVGIQGDGIVIVNPPRGKMTEDDAVNLATWLLQLADYDGGKHEAMKDAIERGE